MSFLTKTNALTYHCNQCPYQSPWKFALANHLNGRHQEISFAPFNCLNRIEPHSCRICPYETEYQVGLLQHQMKNHATQSLSRNFLEVTIKEEHEVLDIKPEIVEFDEAQNKCFRCGLFTYSKIFLFKHLETCELKIQQHNKSHRKGNLKVHHTNQHEEVEEIKWFRCKHCSYKSKWNSDLKKHQTNQHGVGEIKWFNCQHCSYKTKQNSHLKVHRINQHSYDEIKWFKCQHCSYKSKQKSNLNIHCINQHSSYNEIKWLKCQHCSYKSKRKANFQQHQTNQHNIGEIKWFKCQCCSYKSKDKSNLKKHQTKQHDFGGMR